MPHLEKLQRAISLCTHMLLINRRNVKAFLSKAQAYSKLGDYQSAICVYKKALEIDPSNKLITRELYKLEDLGDQKKQGESDFDHTKESYTQSNSVDQDKVMKLDEMVEIREERSNPHNMLVDNSSVVENKDVKLDEVTEIGEVMNNPHDMTVDNSKDQQNGSEITSMVSSKRLSKDQAEEENDPHFRKHFNNAEPKLWFSNRRRQGSIIRLSQKKNALLAQGKDICCRDYKS